jgi:hypothetical protein
LYPASTAQAVQAQAQVQVQVQAQVQVQVQMGVSPLRLASPERAPIVVSNARESSFGFIDTNEEEDEKQQQISSEIFASHRINHPSPPASAAAAVTLSYSVSHTPAAASSSPVVTAVSSPVRTSVAATPASPNPFAMLENQFALPNAIAATSSSSSSSSSVTIPSLPSDLLAPMRALQVAPIESAAPSPAAASSSSSSIPGIGSVYPPGGPSSRQCTHMHALTNHGGAPRCARLRRTAAHFNLYVDLVCTSLCLSRCSDTRDVTCVVR